jgi:D-sedoheptulose 7-phosphate isomerase
MFLSRFKDLAAAVESCKYSTLERSIDENEALHLAFKMIALTRFQNGIVYVIGNGGSAGIASHFSTDLIKSLGIPSQTFYDSNLMTCLSNDWGYEKVFSYPLEKLLKPQDLLVAISSSGKSPNIVKAAEMANSRKAAVITLSGFLAENPLRKLGHLNYWIDRSDYGLVETAHFFLLHTIIDLWHQQAGEQKFLSAQMSSSCM